MEQICTQALEGCLLYVKHVVVGYSEQEIIKTAVLYRQRAVPEIFELM